MTLRRRILLQIVIITVGLLCLMLYFAWSVIVNGAASMENEYMRQNLKRAENALEMEMNRLVTTVSDYAIWNDTYRFVQEYNQEYLESNFAISTYTTNRLNMVIILDGNGKIIYEEWYDYAKQQDLAVSAEMRSLLAKGSLVLSDTYRGVTRWGLVRLPQGDLLIAISPIHTTDNLGPSLGTLVMGRYLNEDIVKGLQQTTALQLSFLDYQSRNTNEEISTVAKNISVDSPSTIRAVDQGTLAGYRIIKDIYQQPALLLKVEQTRDIYLQSKNTTLYIMLIILILGLSYGVVITYYLENLVLRPLAQINRGLGLLGSHGDLSRRLPLVGKYEIANLTNNINSMLGELEKSQLELQESEQRYKYLSYHDPLTGLYNRTFLEHIIADIRANYSSYLPLSIINADVDGLKFINDTLGHQEGDNLLKGASRILAVSVESEDILARIGGDEFCLILPKTDHQTALARKNKIVDAFNSYNLAEPFFPISISLGLATSDSTDIKVDELYQQSDDFMYTYKLSQSDSPKSKIIDLLLAALSERDFIAQGHVQRLVIMAEKMAERLELSDDHRRNLILLAKVHDLGKVGIPDEILFKCDKLTREEYAKMQEHSRIGYNIASRSKELSHIANLILSHHENWNGKGYPIGLKEEEIPLECRILAILDAFDAMTNERPYHYGISFEAARLELLRCSGTQFEPMLVEEFLKLLAEQQENLVS